MQLAISRIVSNGKYVYLVPWMGDKIVNTLTLLMVRAGYKASNFAGVIEIEDATHSAVFRCLNTAVEEKLVSNSDLAKHSGNNQEEKYDHLLPESLLHEGYGAKAFDVDGTMDWITNAIGMNLLQPE